MHYTPHVDLAFNSVEHIIEMLKGLVAPYMHANGARYVLPWQMSFWGATRQSSSSGCIASIWIK
uniref:Uncharacterized protein n=1 Tax=Salix viminalis TaxID=40686 RepID=A0A6N2LDS9_SALVM